MDSGGIRKLMVKYLRSAGAEFLTKVPNLFLHTLIADM